MGRNPLLLSQISLGVGLLVRSTVKCGATLIRRKEKNLAACGIHDVLEYLNQTRTPQGRAEVTKASGIEEGRLGSVAHLVDMARVGIRFSYLNRLTQAGIETLGQLRNSSLAQLRVVLPKRVSDKRLQAWIEQAKKLESVVEE